MRKRLKSFTLAPDVVEMLANSDNQSRYLEQLVRHYPPRFHRDLEDLAVSIKEEHPWARDPKDWSIRTDLPKYGGFPPIRRGCVSWDYDRVLREDGEIFDRKGWERGDYINYDRGHINVDNLEPDDPIVPRISK